MSERTDACTIEVVMRCRNEMPWTKQAIEALRSQRRVRVKLLVIDCGSTDGSRECAVREGARVIDVDPKAYIPGAVLNMGMRETDGELVAFINADAIALDPYALEALIRPLIDDPMVAAAYGRQVPRREADPWMRADTERAFGAHQAGRTRNGAFFSMAASAVRRSWWQRLPFDEALRYSEDVDWTHRVRVLGARIRYVPEARFEHSHQYDLRAHFRRRRGEGAADTLIFGLASPSIVREGVVPLLGALLRDARAGIASPYGVATRVAQVSGYLVGRAWGFES
jgi:rhamnosyltransferase